MAKTNAVIIKKIKKGAHGHHGGAWKVAYADFVTAMMAFFLLLWLLNATTDAQKRGIADYFSPTLATKSLTSGAGGVMGGKTMAQPGSAVSSSAEPSVTVEMNRPPDVDPSDDDDSPGKVPNDLDAKANGPGDPNSDEPQTQPTSDPRHLSATDKADLAKIGAGATEFDKLSDGQVKQLMAMREDRQFKETAQQLRQALDASPELKPLAENVKIDQTPDGLRIQLVDQDKSAMFPIGSSDPGEDARKLMALVAKAVKTLPNKIAITGHTDATPYRGLEYDNYDLSVERARAMRHALLGNGTASDRIETVQGKGATDPIQPDNPSAAINRRVSIVLLREHPSAAAK